METIAGIAIIGIKFRSNWHFKNLLYFTSNLCNEFEKYVKKKMVFR